MLRGCVVIYVGLGFVFINHAMFLDVTLVSVTQILQNILPNILLQRNSVSLNNFLFANASEI